MVETKTVCGHCGVVIKKRHYDFSITTPTKYDNFYACSEECFKNLLHKQGIATYPALHKQSMKISKIALAIAITALTIQIILTILTLL